MFVGAILFISLGLSNGAIYWKSHWLWSRFLITQLPSSSWFSKTKQTFPLPDKKAVEFNNVKGKINIGNYSVEMIRDIYICCCIVFNHCNKLNKVFVWSGFCQKMEFFLHCTFLWFFCCQRRQKFSSYSEKWREKEGRGEEEMRPLLITFLCVQVLKALTSLEGTRKNLGEKGNWLERIFFERFILSL